MLAFSDSNIQTHEIIQKSKLDTFITEWAQFSAYRHPALQTELKQHVDQCKFKTKTLQNWTSMPDEKKERFLSQTPLQNKDQVFFICCKTYNFSRETSKMVACDVCNEWYCNSCIDFKPSFNPYVPLFICNYSIDSRIYHFIPFLSSMLCDIFDTYCISIKQCFNEFLAKSEAIKLRLMYHKFHSLQQQNQNKKLIDKVKILSTKNIYFLSQCSQKSVVLLYS